MKIIQLKCPSCGANLKVSDKLKSYTCNFCGATSILDNEVIKIEHTFINPEVDELYKKLDGYIKINNKEKMNELIDQVIDKRPYDPRTWLYAIKVETNNYSATIAYDEEQVEEYLDNYIALEDNDVKLNENVQLIRKYLTKQNNIIKNITNDESMICPYCSRNIQYGQKKCDYCDKELYWPDI